MAQKEVAKVGTKIAQDQGASETLTQQAFPDTQNAPPIRGQGPWDHPACALTCLCDECVIFATFGVSRSVQRAARRNAERRGEYSRYFIAEGVEIPPAALHLASEAVKARRRADETQGIRS